MKKILLSIFATVALLCVTSCGDKYDIHPAKTTHIVYETNSDTISADSQIVTFTLPSYPDEDIKFVRWEGYCSFSIELYEGENREQLYCTEISPGKDIEFKDLKASFSDDQKEITLSVGANTTPYYRRIKLYTGSIYIEGTLNNMPFSTNAGGFIEAWVFQAPATSEK